MKEEKKEETIDRRIRKTRRLLRECLTALLKEKKVQDITVREIADMADINRGTFYLHYKDVFDLMEQIENELLKELEDMLNAVTNATEIMSRRKIGALMVFERETGLEERIETGVPIDGLISDSLLLNIFEPDTPLHDGAVVIRGNRIVAASCLLPLTEARNLSQELGTRHRSAIGISEQSDALVLVVSEETGTISLARNGELHRYLTGEDIKSLLRAAVVQPSLNWKQVINDKIKEIRGGK